jgi:hypothetical protein
MPGEEVGRAAFAELERRDPMIPSMVPTASHSASAAPALRPWLRRRPD